MISSIIVPTIMGIMVVGVFTFMNYLDYNDNTQTKGKN